MTAYSYCQQCDTTIDVDDDHFDDNGNCVYEDVRDVLRQAQELEPDWGEVITS